MNYKLNEVVKNVTNDISTRFNFNTALSFIMELVNVMYKYIKAAPTVNKALLNKSVEDVILMLAPFGPHFTEELWKMIGKNSSVHAQKWPEYNESALVKDNIELVIQINGKVRDKIIVESTATKDELEKIAMNTEKIKSFINGKNVVKIIVIPKKLVNIVVK